MNPSPLNIKRTFYNHFLFCSLSILFGNPIFSQTNNSALTGLKINSQATSVRPELVWTDKNENENYVARHEFGFVQAGDKFIMFGGRENSQTLDVYDYSSNTWSNGGMAPVEFNHFQAVNYEGLAWVIGAFKTNNDPNEVSADYIYMYNPASEVWTQGMEIPQARKRGANGLVVYNNKFYMVGGNNLGHNGGYVAYFDEFDPATGIWTSLTDAPRARDHFHAAVYNDKLYAIGGRLSGGSGGTFEPQVPEVDVYNFGAGTWSTLDASKNIPTPRAGVGAVVFEDEIYIIGGETTFGSPTNSNGQRDVVEAFNPITSIWTTKNSLNYARHGIQAIVSGDGIHVAGGSEGGTSIKNMEVYGTDNPTGSPNVNSTFAPDETTKAFTYMEADGSVDINILLSNTAGTTGTYIKSVVISGANYTLAENYANRLLGANKNLTISVALNDTTQPESNGNVAITYDNNVVINVILDGELDGALSIDSANVLNHNIKVYPNPVKNMFSLNKNITQLSVYDITGKLIKTFNGQFNKGKIFDISNLSQSLYFAKIENASGEKNTIKLVKL